MEKCSSIRAQEGKTGEKPNQNKSSEERRLKQSPERGDSGREGSGKERAGGVPGASHATGSPRRR